ncbi:MAG: hypothetical protein KF688_16105 [Pirellulales bacterium]|nr:hypothetical protein [Pirellulales bacterium]
MPHVGVRRVNLRLLTALGRRSAAFSLVLTTFVGCGGLPASVSGVVTLDGKPLERGVVGFAPTAGGPRAAGAIQSDGSYTLRTNRESGLAVGEYVVTVVAREPGETPAGGGPPMPGAFITPRHYAVEGTSGLRYTVERGSNTINIELTAKNSPTTAANGR